jgi:hypothetical protein
LIIHVHQAPNTGMARAKDRLVSRKALEVFDLLHSRLCGIMRAFQALPWESTCTQFCLSL